MDLIRDLATVTIHDGALVGGKAASLGEMIRALASRDIRIPQGFVITTEAYRALIQSGIGNERIVELIGRITDYKNLELVHTVGNELRTAIMHMQLPSHLVKEISAAYRALSHYYRIEDVAVAVRSSATAEDLPT